MKILNLEGTVKESYYEDTIAIRSDWESVQASFNTILDLLKRNGSIKRLFDSSFEELKEESIVL